MPLRYEYSDAESYYVLLTFLVFAVLPGTYYLASRPDPTTAAAEASQARAEGKVGPHADAPSCPCSACTETKRKRESIVDILTREAPIGVQKPKENASLLEKLWYHAVAGFSLPYLLLGYGWMALLYVGYKVVMGGKQVVVWDPHEILGVAEGATKAEIRKAYRALSLTAHPDKVASHLKKMAQEKFNSIAKAYKVLTDEAARLNFERYGSPDGPQATSFGIALPRWMSNTTLVVGLYLGVLGLIAYAAYRYFKYGSISGDSSKELDNGLKKEPLEKLASSFKGASPTSPFLTVDNALTMVAGTARAHHVDLALTQDDLKLLPKPVQTASSNPAMHLLQAHMHRVGKVPPAFVETCDKAADAVFALAVQRGRWQDVPAALTAARCVVGATKPGDSALVATVPHVTAGIAQKAGWANVSPLGLYKQGRAAFDKAVASAGLTPEQRDEAWQAIGNLPHVAITGCTFGDMTSGATPGNETPAHADSGVVAATVKLLITTVHEHVTSLESGDATGKATPSPSKSGVKNRKAGKNDKNGNVNNEDSDKPPAVLSRPLPPAHAHTPYFPGAKRAGVWLFVTENTRGNKHPCPILNGAFIGFDDTALLRARDDATGEVTVRVGIQGPKVAGIFSIGINVIGSPVAPVEEVRSFKMRLERWGKKQRQAAGIEDAAIKAKDAVERYPVIEVPAPKNDGRAPQAVEQAE